MKTLVLCPAYFAPIAHWVPLAHSTPIVWETQDHYQKQTYRNRAYIATANGKLMLNIPVKHTQKGTHQKYQEVRIENDFPWQQQHWKSLESAYRSSPFFEFYEDDLNVLYTTPALTLLDFNMRCIRWVCESLQLNAPEFTTTNYHKTLPSEHTDGRDWIHAKGNQPIGLDPYIQVFSEKNGFLANLSVLDLIFNEGPNAVSYLKKSRP